MWRVAPRRRACLTNRSAACWRSPRHLRRIALVDEPSLKRPPTIAFARGRGHEHCRVLISMPEDVADPKSENRRK